MNINLLIVIVYAIASAVTFATYGCDKLAALRGGRRVSERTLHFLALCGGWPGGLAGQLAFRHKTRKISFRLCFWLTVLINGTILGIWRGYLP